MILYQVIFILLVFSAIYDYKNTFLFYTAFKILINQDVFIYNSPTIPFAATFEIFYFILLLFKNKVNFRNYYPLRSSVIFGIITILITASLSSYPKFSEFNLAIQAIFNTFAFPYMLYLILQDERDIKKVWTFFYCVLSLVTIYSIFEFLTDSNPIREFQKSINNVSDVFETYKRLGVTRTTSFFSHATAYSAVCVYFISFIYYYRLNYRSLLTYNKIAPILAALLVFGAIAALTRSSLLIFFILITPIILNKKILKLKTILLVVIIMIVSLPYTVNFIETMLVGSLDSKNTEIEGSSIEMRQLQYETIISIASQKPLWGHGLSSIISKNSVFSGYEREILGYESIWLGLMTTRGVMGILCYIYIFIDILRKLIQKRTKIYMYALVLGWLGISTLTSLPGIGEWFIISLVIILHKTEYVVYRKNIIMTNHLKFINSRTI